MPNAPLTVHVYDPVTRKLHFARVLRRSLTALLFVAAYCGLIEIALTAGDIEHAPILLWPAVGLLVAILLHAPRSQWPAFLVLAGLGSGVCLFLAGAGPVFATTAAVAHVVEAWIGARLLRRAKRRDADLLREWLADAAAIGVIAPFTAALALATAMYHVSGWNWAEQFTRYAFAHGLGALVFFPAFSLLVGGTLPRWFERQTMARRTEFVAFLLLVAVTTCGAMWQGGFAAYLVPVLAALIATCRFGMPAASTSVFVLAVAAWAAFLASTQLWSLPVAGLGGEGFVQFYLAVVVICLQPLAGYITQNRRLANVLKERDFTNIEIELSLEAKDFAIAENRGMYRLLAENMSDIIIKTDVGGFILYASPSAERLGDIHPIELVGKHIQDLIHPSYGASFQSTFDSVVKEGHSTSAWTEFLGFFSSTGTERWFDTRIRAWREADGVLGGAIVTLRSIEERKALEQQLFVAVLTDPLTNLTNRRAFNSMLEYHIEAPIEGCLAIFDIDDFRSINREYGHAVGDRVLTSVARLLRSLLRKEDIISRIGGERFAVLLSGASPDQAEALCQRVVTTLFDMAGPEGMNGPRATVSAGVARIEGTMDETMKRADEAVVIAKAKGRNRLEMATSRRLGWSPGKVPWIEGSSGK